jgi:hypothetical protein
MMHNSHAFSLCRTWAWFASMSQINSMIKIIKRRFIPERASPDLVVCDNKQARNFESLDSSPLYDGTAFEHED